MKHATVSRHSGDLSTRILILALQREGNRILSDALRPYGVNPAQAEVIELLALHGSLSIKQIGSMLICEGGSPSRLIQTMRSRGILDVREDTNDRRVHKVDLSVRGRKLVFAVQSIFKELDRNITNRIEEGYQEKFQTILSALLQDTASMNRILKRFRK